MRSFINSAVIAFVFLSSAASANPELSAAQLRKQLDAMNSLQGSFTQVLLDEKGKKIEESKGIFSLQRPGKFYWKTETPFPQLLVSNHQKIWLYDLDLETVTERAFSDDLQQTPALLLSASVEKLRENFTVNQVKASKNTEQYTLMPKVTDGLFQQLTLVFVAGELKEFQVQDALGQVSQFSLTNVKRNETISPALFEFTPPDGVEVLKN